MELALLGTDTESLALAQAAVALGHRLLWCGDVADPLPSGWPAEDLAPQWESLLDGRLAVIVGRGRAERSVRSEQINQLVKQGVTLLTTFPLSDSVLSYYEIDMARGESGALLQHFNPLAEQYPVIESCARWIASGQSDGEADLGAVEQVVWERPLETRTQAHVLWHFARDVELLTLVAGRLNRLGALGSPDQQATYSGLSVQLLGDREVPVRWQVGPIENNTNARLVLIAQRGKRTLTFSAAGDALEQTVVYAGETQTVALPPVDAASQAIQRLVRGVTDPSGGSTWSRALTAMELADTIEISLRRGRMIEVHQQQLTEALAFKGTMSALGCGVLLVLPPLLLFCGWAAELLGLPLHWTKFWPYPLLGLLGLFLLAQLIPTLFFSRSDSTPADAAAADSAPGE